MFSITNFKNFSFILVSGLLLAASCKGEKKSSQEDSMTATDSTDVVEETAKITLSKLEGSPDFPEASLMLKQPTANKVNDTLLNFEFEVSNYELTAQTDDSLTNILANSDKGQHIHLIVDNDPYSAHYEPTFSKGMAEGNHVVLAFLSRSYHESVKNAQSFIVKQITVGNMEEDKADLSAPHMFYSRPKGSYEGAATEKLLLDFFLVNTTLSPNGNKVKATINGEEFMIDEWAPYVVEGLPKGEATFKLELMDASGNLIESPFNPVERTVTLK